MESFAAVILGSQIRLRALEPEDVELLYQWENSTEFMRFGDVHLPFSRHLLRTYLDRSGEDFYQIRQLRMMIETLDSDPRVVGHIDLFDYEPQHNKAALGMMIAEERDRGRGYASEALTSMMEYAREYLGLRQIYCTVQLWNSTSFLLFESKGFERSGILRDWIRTGKGYEDVCMLQKILG